MSTTIETLPCQGSKTCQFENPLKVVVNVNQQHTPCDADSKKSSYLFTALKYATLLTLTYIAYSYLATQPDVMPKEVLYLPDRPGVNFDDRQVGFPNSPSFFAPLQKINNVYQGVTETLQQVVWYAQSGAVILGTFAVSQFVHGVARLKNGT